ncbi:hypothetical protein NDU88_001506 [Pleurodeles waltl]|uniref:Uncharacterized protein n=1 Tax=Pleurodeles waltl TaxID=8319 RepID=A0AAV7SZE0_PLEWA|nr:hypothetical protein NDU88_001506 [Pleurodeles waltl]
MCVTWRLECLALALSPNRGSRSCECPFAWTPFPELPRCSLIDAVLSVPVRVSCQESPETSAGGSVTDHSQQHRQAELLPHSPAHTHIFFLQFFFPFGIWSLVKLFCKIGIRWDGHPSPKKERTVHAWTQTYAATAAHEVPAEEDTQQFRKA